MLMSPYLGEDSDMTNFTDMNHLHLTTNFFRFVCEPSALVAVHV